MRFVLLLKLGFKDPVPISYEADVFNQLPRESSHGNHVKEENFEPTMETTKHLNIA